MTRQASRLAALAVVLAAVVIAGCRSTSGAVPRPFPMPGGAGPAPAPMSPPVASAPAAPEPTTPPRPGQPFPTVELSGTALVDTALRLRGAPYRNGGSDPAGFDCSGFVQYVFAQNGLWLPREVREQFVIGQEIGRDKVAPGDLLFFSTVARGASHVGVALGGNRFVHAPNSAGTVRVESLAQGYWGRRYVGARRLIGTLSASTRADGPSASP